MMRILAVVAAAALAGCVVSDRHHGGGHGHGHGDVRPPRGAVVVHGHDHRGGSRHERPKPPKHIAKPVVVKPVVKPRPPSPPPVAKPVTPPKAAKARDPNLRYRDTKKPPKKGSRKK